MNANLLDACRSGNVKRVEELVAAGHSHGEPLDTVGTTPLMAAGTLEVLGFLLNMGASLAPTRFGHDVLQVVVSDDESAFEDAAVKEFLALMFFKGALLDDPEGVLEDQGPNSRSARRMRFTSVEEVERLTDTVKAYIDEAIEVEAAGLEVGPAPELVLVEELQNRLDQDPALAAAFESLTPGRQREYNLYFSGAKQAKTREARVEKYAQKVMEGKGFRDR